MLNSLQREEKWSNSIAVGSEAFIKQINASLGIKAIHRKIVKDGSSYQIKEGIVTYRNGFDSKMDFLKEDNTVYLDEI